MFEKFENVAAFSTNLVRRNSLEKHSLTSSHFRSPIFSIAMKSHRVCSTLRTTTYNDISDAKKEYTIFPSLFCCQHRWCNIVDYLEPQWASMSATVKVSDYSMLFSSIETVHVIGLSSGLKRLQIWWKLSIGPFHRTIWRSTYCRLGKRWTVFDQRDIYVYLLCSCAQRQLYWVTSILTDSRWVWPTFVAAAITLQFADKK